MDRAGENGSVSFTSGLVCDESLGYPRSFLRASSIATAAKPPVMSDAGSGVAVTELKSSVVPPGTSTVKLEAVELLETARDIK